MIRFIIFFGVGYLLYRSIKSWMFPSASSIRSATGQNQTEIDDVMIKDPFCEAYFPQRNGVHLRREGRDLYFCSSRCRDDYIAAHSDGEKQDRWT